jgi:hypothetical protein
MRQRLPNGPRLYIDPGPGATWRSGYATVCKTVYTSSILVVASIIFSITYRLLFDHRLSLARRRKRSGHAR